MTSDKWPMTDVPRSREFSGTGDNEEFHVFEVNVRLLPSKEACQITWQPLAILENEFASLPTSLPWLADSVDSVKPQRTGRYVTKEIECARMPGSGEVGGRGG